MVQCIILERGFMSEVNALNDIENNLLTAIQMYLYQADRLNGVDIHSSDYKTSVEEQAMGMFKLVEDIIKGSE